jgi:hypothetical protein
MFDGKIFDGYAYVCLLHKHSHIDMETIFNFDVNILLPTFFVRACVFCRFVC